MRLLELLLFAGILLVSGCSSGGAPGFSQTEELQYSASRSAVVEAEGADSIRIRAEAGTLAVVGRDTLSRVQADGTARTSREGDLDDVQIEARREGNVIVVTTQFPQGSRERMRLDLTVEMPRRLAASVTDASGDLTVKNHGGPTLDVTDSSGDLTVETDTAAVSIQDGSGNIALRGGRSTTIYDASGDIDVREAGTTEVKDTSGDVTIQRLDGDLTLQDSSGDIRVETIDGTVKITEDASGDIRITDVTGDVIIVQDGSGDIVVKRVGGDFTVKRDSSGDIDHDDVEGSVSLPEEN